MKIRRKFSLYIYICTRCVETRELLARCRYKLAVIRRIDYASWFYACNDPRKLGQDSNWIRLGSAYHDRGGYTFNILRWPAHLRRITEREAPRFRATRCKQLTFWNRQAIWCYGEFFRPRDLRGDSGGIENFSKFIWNQRRSSATRARCNYLKRKKKRRRKKWGILLQNCKC